MPVHLRAPASPVQEPPAHTTDRARCAALRRARCARPGSSSGSSPGPGPGPGAGTGAGAG